MRSSIIRSFCIYLMPKIKKILLNACACFSCKKKGEKRLRGTVAVTFKNGSAGRRMYNIEMQ